MAQLQATILQEINALYVAVYGRAADGPGIDYWCGQLNVTPSAASNTAVTTAQSLTLGQAFVNSQATYFTAQYGSLSDIAFIQKLYQNIGGNAGDSVGIQYWFNLLQLAEGSSPTAAQIQAARAGLVGQFSHDMLSVDLTVGAAALGLSAGDYAAAQARQQQFQNKVSVSQFYADASRVPVTGGNPLLVTSTTSAAFAAAQNVINSVNNNPTSLAVADAAILAAVTSNSLTPITNLVPVPPFAATFTLTTGQDTLLTGTGNDLYFAPVSATNAPSLTNFDNLTDSGNGNVLQAFFNNAGAATIVGTTIKGIQSWVFSNAGGGVVNLNGGLTVGGTVGGPGPSGPTSTNPAVSSISLTNSTASVTVGGLAGIFTAGTGIQSVLSTINLSNNAGGILTVAMLGTLFSGTNALTVNVSNVVGGSGAVFAGPDALAVGYQTWNVVVQDTAGDTVSLNAMGATNATTVNLSNSAGATGALTLTAGTPGEWANVATINGSGMTGALTVTGTETTGFLTADPALKSITGGAANDLFDLTNLTAAKLQAMTTINGGGGTGNQVDIASSQAVILTAALPLTSEQIVGLAGALSGTLNDAFYPGVTQFKMENANGGTGGSLNGNLAVTNAANGLNFNFQASTLGANNFSITDASTTSITDSVTLTFGGLAAVATGSMTSTGFNTVNLVETGANTVASTNVFTATANPGGGITLNNSGTGGLTLGNVTAAALGTDSVQLDSSGSASSAIINDTSAGAFVIGVTNAKVINAGTATGTLSMTAPDDNAGITVTGGKGATNTLQGSLSATPTSFADTINSNGTADAIFGDGGKDIITLSTAVAHTDNIWIGAYTINGTNTALPINTAFNTFSTNFVAGGSDLFTTVNNFTVGTAKDVIDIKLGAFIGGTGLNTGDLGTSVGVGDALIQHVVSAGSVIFAGTTVVADGISNYASAAALVTGLATIDGVIFSNTVGRSAEILFAYQNTTGGVNIAEVSVAVAAAAGNTTVTTTLTAHDLVTLTGVTLASVAASNIHFA